MLKLIQEEKDDKKRKADEEHLVQLSKLMMEQFPREEAGKLGRFYVTQDLIKKDQLEEALAIPGAGNDVFFSVAMKYFEKENYLKAIELYEKITPDFSRYIIAQFYRADAALKIAANNEVLKNQGKPPIKLNNGKNRTSCLYTECLEICDKALCGSRSNGPQFLCAKQNATCSHALYRKKIR